MPGDGGRSASIADRDTTTRQLAPWMCISEALLEDLSVHGEHVRLGVRVDGQFIELDGVLDRVAGNPSTGDRISVLALGDGSLSIYCLEGGERS